jgi:hypothetical protein
VTVALKRDYYTSQIRRGEPARGSESLLVQIGSKRRISRRIPSHISPELGILRSRISPELRILSPSAAKLRRLSVICSWHLGTLKSIEYYNLFLRRSRNFQNTNVNISARSIYLE